MPLNYRIQILLSTENKEFSVSTFQTIKMKVLDSLLVFTTRIQDGFLKCQINRDMP
jgi:hypothetical protein